jgi:hypothetical protein
MTRPDDANVKAILRDGGDYGPLPDGTEPSLTLYIDTAGAVMDQVVICATRKRITLADNLLNLIWLWLAAHYYAVSDRPVQSKSTGGGSASFQGQTAMRFEFTGYGQQALALDVSGCLNAFQTNARAGGVWLGKRKRDQLTYADRN